MSKGGRLEPESLTDAHGPLPDGWAWSSVEDLLVEPTCNGISIKGSDTPPGEPALRLSAMSGRGFDYTERRYIPISREIAEELAIKEGDLYVSRGNGSLRLLGRSTLAQEPPERIVFPDTMIRLRFSGGPTVAKYINYVWESQVVRSQIESKARTTAGIYKISQTDVRAFALPIPPAEEQRRIVAKIEELFSELDAGVAALERVRAGLKRYRAAVLKAAVEGKLTEDWRAQHPDTEPASVLLERILAERRHQWEETQLVKFAQAEKKPPVAWQLKYPSPTIPDQKSLPLLPETWRWSTLDQLIVWGPQNGLYLPATAYGDGIPILRIDDFNDFSSRPASELRRVRAPSNDITNYSLQEEDVVINRVNSLTHLGKTLVVKGRNTPSLFESNMMRMRLCQAVLPDYVGIVLRSMDGRFRLLANAKWAVNQASINQKDVAMTAVPLPPFLEQLVIVREVERRLSLVDEIEAQVEANLKRAARLRQGILKRAFEGKLVPQDPTDETAEQLLARIRQGRQSSTVSKNGKPATRRHGQHRKPGPALPLLTEDDGADEGGE